MSISLRYQFTYCNLLYTFLNNYFFEYEQKGNRQHLLRALFKLAKYTTSTIHYVVTVTQLATELIKMPCLLYEYEQRETASTY